MCVCVCVFMQRYGQYVMSITRGYICNSCPVSVCACACVCVCVQSSPFIQRYYTCVCLSRAVSCVPERVTHPQVPLRQRGACRRQPQQGALHGVVKSGLQLEGAEDRDGHWVISMQHCNPPTTTTTSQCMPLWDLSSTAISRRPLCQTKRCFYREVILSLLIILPCQIPQLTWKSNAGG